MCVTGQRKSNTLLFGSFGRIDLRTLEATELMKPGVLGFLDIVCTKFRTGLDRVKNLPQSDGVDEKFK